MGRSSNVSNSALISGESGPAYFPNFPPVSHHHYSSSPQNHHQIPSPHHHHLHQSQYLSASQLASAAQFYGNEVNGNNSTGPSNNLTPPTRVYSPLSHGSNSSTGSSALSYASSNGNGVGHAGPSGTLIDVITNSGVNISGNGGVKYELSDFPQEVDGGPVKTTTWKEHVSVFSLEQVGVMCDVLLQEADMPRLIELLSTTAKDFIGRSEKILRAQAHVAYHAALEDPRKFSQVYKILESHTFSLQYHAGLQKLWFNAHYKEAEITRGRPQGAVDKYRIRRKFPLPRTIWDGEETIYCFKEKSRNALRESFRLEKYPNLEEKKKLSKETGLSMTQVGNWFKNKRQREKEKEQGKQATKRSPKNVYNTPVALAAAAAMNPEFLGLMLNGGGGAMTSPAAHHLSPHHPHHPHHHPSIQPQIAPMSPEEFENALRKGRFADEAQVRLKSYMDDSGVFCSVVGGASSTTSSSPSSANSSGPTNLATYLGPNGSNNDNNNGSPSTKSMGLSRKSDITIGIVGSSPNSGGGHNIMQQNQQSPRSSGGLTITAIPSPNDREGNVQQNEASPSDHDSLNVNTSSPLNEDIDGGIYITRPRSNDSVRCGGAELIPYLQHHHHPPPHHHQHNNQHLHHSQHIQHHSQHPMVYHNHHHHLNHAHSPLPYA